jgi:hypothetical protein
MAGIGRRMTRLRLHLHQICSRRLTTYFSAIRFRCQTNKVSEVTIVGQFAIPPGYAAGCRMTPHRFFRLARGGR